MSDLAKPLGLTTAAQGGMGAVIPDVPADHISAGALAGVTFRGGAQFSDTLPGVFYPVTIDAAGNITINSSANHVSTLKFHDTANVLATDLIDYVNNNTRFLAPNSATSIAMLLAILDRNALTGANGVEVDAANRRIFFLSNGGGANAAITWDNTTLLTFSGIFAGSVQATSLTVSGNVGFYGTGATAKQTVTGSRGGNAALASLLTALATIGLIVDNTTA